MYFQSPENSVDLLARVYTARSRGARTSKTYGSASIRVLTDERLRWRNTPGYDGCEGNSQTYSSTFSQYLSRSLG